MSSPLETGCINFIVRNCGVCLKKSVLVLLLCRLIGISVVGSNRVMKKVDYSWYPNPIWVDFKG